MAIARCLRPAVAWCAIASPAPAASAATSASLVVTFLMAGLRAVLLPASRLLAAFGAASLFLLFRKMPWRQR
jgi:hypothetical protein